MAQKKSVVVLWPGRFCRLRHSMKRLLVNRRNIPIAYGLGNKGAAWLKRELSIPFHALDWKRKGHVGRLFLQHALMVSDVMVALEIACQNRPDIRLLSPDDLKIPKMREPFQWQVEIGQRRKIGVIPDRVFGLEFNGKQCWYCLEAPEAPCQSHAAILTKPVSSANCSPTDQRPFLTEAD